MLAHHFQFNIGNFDTSTKKINHPLSKSDFFSMKVLICEDEEIMLTAIEFRLQKAGFGILRAKNGQQAIDVLKNAEVGMIVLDMVMPETDCYEVIYQIREELKQETPIILLAPIEKKDEEVLEAFRMGIDDFVVKPFKPTELILRIKKIFQDKGIVVVKEKLSNR